MQGHLTPDTVAYASGLGTGTALGALLVGVYSDTGSYLVRQSQIKIATLTSLLTSPPILPPSALVYYIECSLYHHQCIL